MHKKISYFYVLAAACLWGTIGVFIRYLSGHGLLPAQLICFRAWVSAAIMIVWMAAKDRSLLSIRPRDIWMFVGTGIISFVLFNYCYICSLQLVSLSTAAILLYTAPIFVAVLSVWLFKERFTVVKLVSLSMAFVGCVLVSGFSSAGTQSPIGVLLGLLSGLFYALYSIFGKFALRRYASLTVTTYTFVFASIGIAPFGNYPHMASLPWTGEMVLILLAFAGGSGALAYLLYTKGLERLQATDAAVAAILEPVVAALTGALFFQETLGAIGILGIALVIAAILILSIAPPFSGRDRS